ncbi:Hydrogenase isoenzymes formation protein HypC [Maioricimonas rarisocia]|uniref:Hydrogenase isoenzymes formation protein HypC n=1 Tax=Maioricimonas rarisocia TaxID=2528026 RepID=A0A517Z6I9_9PLAN|nr:HypC/HybG/HupF family hydrogenase formation chaperone [Maioricimonas rarisocia]QDU38106.1 Hydrogenase isoenzymes formation protein HypC [Maioricimonas rarisocia]
MCLGVPGQVVEWLDRDPVFGRASIEFEGVRRVCHMACVPHAEVGEYVVVHAGIAISLIDSAEAQRLLDELRTLGLDDELPSTGDENRLDTASGELSP